MSLPDETEDDEIDLNDLPAQPALRAFAREELVSCAECARANAPTRMNCLYCGARLPATERTVPTLRPLETWERGFNVVLLPGQSPRVTDEAVAEAASLVRSEVKRLREMLDARLALPLGRAASDEEAGLVKKRLAALGFGVEIVPDEILAVETAPSVRVKRLAFENATEGATLEGWTAMSGGERHVALWSDVVLLVAGRLFTKRVEVEESRTRVGVEGKVVDAREIADDEGVIDIFFARGETNWRVMSESFDYSCLGARKKMLAHENFVTLVETLRERAPADARFDDNYRGVRHLLASAWPLAERTESRGLRRERPGKFNVEAVTHVSNETQFTRYARLLHQLELKRRGEGAQK